MFLITGLFLGFAFCHSVLGQYHMLGGKEQFTRGYMIVLTSTLQAY